MTQKQGSGESPWTDGAPEVETAGPAPFNGGELWIGRHTADEDILVFDPAVSDPLAERISLYSLTQHRQRAFPRSVVLEQIHEITDEIGWKRARHEYEDRAARQRDHAEAAAVAQAGRLESQRQGVLAAHRRYLAAIGYEYLGVEPTPAAHRPGRRSKCHVCGIGLDDFASTICKVCNGVLCSCGACACSLTGKGRPAKSEEG